MILGLSGMEYVNEVAPQDTPCDVLHEHHKLVCLTCTPHIHEWAANAVHVNNLKCEIGSLIVSQHEHTDSARAGVCPY